MWRVHFLIICFVLAKKIAAQGNEIGLSILSFNTINTNYFQTDTVVHSKMNSIVSFQPVLTYNHISEKNIDLSTQIGFFYTPRKTKDKSSDQTSTIYYNHNNFLQKSIYFKLGFARRNYINKLILISGINIPFQISYSTKVQNYRSTYNIRNDTLIANYHYSDSFAPEYTTGINLQQSFYYAIKKRIYLGIDFNLGFITILMNGKRHITESEENYINPSVSYSKDLTIIYKNNLQTSLFFQPSVSIKINLNN